MKNIIAALLLVILSTGCGDDMTINGVEYETKGLITKDEKDPCVQYKVIVGNVIWGTVLVATVWAPVYFWGFSVYEPTGQKNTPECKQNAQ